MKRIRTLFFCTLALVISRCKNENNLHLSIENSSQIDSVLEVVLIINDTVKIRNIIPRSKETVFAKNFSIQVQSGINRFKFSTNKVTCNFDLDINSGKEYSIYSIYKDRFKNIPANTIEMNDTPHFEVAIYDNNGNRILE
jgi:hypothetical protein